MRSPTTTTCLVTFCEGPEGADGVRALLALAVMLAMGAAGCGKRGDPLPPLQRIPTAVNKPRVSQQGQEIVIVWETPSGTVDGGALELTGAELLRRVVEPPAAPPLDARILLPSLPADAPEEGEPPSEAEGNEPVGLDEVSPEEPPEQQEGTQTEEATEDATEPTEPTEDAGTVVPGLAVTASRPASFASEAKVFARIECSEPGERLEYRDTWDPEWVGKRVEYAVRHVNSKGIRSENSNRSWIEPLPPVPAPSELEAVAENGYVHLTWSHEPEPELAEPEPEMPDRVEPEVEPEAEPGTKEVELEFGFNVYRRRNRAESYPAAALNRRLLETTGFEDRDAEFRREWCYTVRRVAVRPTPEPTELAAELVRAEDPTPENTRGRRGRASRGASGERGRQAPQVAEPPALIESTGSEEVCLTPIDTFAPSVPEGVVAIGVPGGGILLSWSESDASDLEGYRVYRAEQRDGPFEPLTSELIEVPSFTDQELTPGTSYFYTVSAVDGTEPANESPRSEVVAAEALE